MRKIFVIASMLCFFSEAMAQIKLPQPSVKGSIEQMVGLTEVEVSYTRPAKRGRKIFGELVPYNRVWRTGANENTTISFSEDVSIAGKVLPKGKYALYTKPEADKWTFYFYKKNDNWGVPQQWDETQIALQAEAKPISYPMETEYLTIELNPINYNDGKIAVRWDKTLVELPFHTQTQEQSMENIADKITATSSARDYYEAANYLLTSNGDLNKANEFISKSLSMQNDAPYYMYRAQAIILSKLGKTKEAIKAAETSLQKAKKEGNEDYVKMNQDSISQWKKKDRNKKITGNRNRTITCYFFSYSASM